MICSDCKHWKKWKEEPYTLGPKTLSVGNCYESSYAKTFGNHVTPHDAKACRCFEVKEGDE